MTEYFWTLAFTNTLITLELYLGSVFSTFDKDPSDKDHFQNTAWAGGYWSPTQSPCLTETSLGDKAPFMVIGCQSLKDSPHFLLQEILPPSSMFAITPHALLKSNSFLWCWCLFNICRLLSSLPYNSGELSSSLKLLVNLPTFDYST